MMTPIPGSQKQRVLAELRQHPEGGICISDMERADWTCVLTMRNRIGELRREGYDIRGEKCDVHRHSGPVFRYTLSVAADLSGDASYHSGRAERADASKGAPSRAGLLARCDRTARGPEVPSITTPGLTPAGQLGLSL